MITSKTYTIETRLNQRDNAEIIEYAKEYNVLYGKMLRFTWHRYNNGGTFNMKKSEFNTLLQRTFGVNKRLANSVISEVEGLYKALYQLKWYEYGQLKGKIAKKRKKVEKLSKKVYAIREKAKKDGIEPLVMVEQRLDISKYVPEGFGTGDCVIIADKTLHIVDYKHGKGVEVSAENNPQMMCYALGAAEMFGILYDIETVHMTIFQPRLANVSEWSISIKELYNWAETVLKPAAELAYKGEGEFKAGTHCKFCKIKASCRKRMEYNMELARYDFAMPDTLEDAEVAILLGRLDELISWASDVKEYALQQALCGKNYDGYKVVEGRASRKYSDDEKVAEAVKAAGYDPYEQKLLGITAMTSLMGKKKFEEVLGGLLVKPQGKPTLVPESDKRPPMNVASDDFKEDK